MTPIVVIVVGVEGVGKTTFAGRLADKMAGKVVVLGACATLRASDVAQVEGWARHTGAVVHKGKACEDPASVAFEAVRKARVLSADAVIIDTAGKAATATSRLAELARIKRAVTQAGCASIETLVVLDASHGVNSAAQAAFFADHVNGAVFGMLDHVEDASALELLRDCESIKVPLRFKSVGPRTEDLAEV